MMLRVVIIKPSKYGLSGHVDRFRRGFMPNSTVPYLRSMTPSSIDDVPIETVAVDEYVQTDRFNAAWTLRPSPAPAVCGTA
jgi:hypothetical protein